MFTYFEKSKTQKELFFQLSRSMTIERDEKAIKGVYVIFKDNICVYVGQSLNIASRLATHLSGKYKNADKVIVFEPQGEEDLTITEKYCIQKLQPVENVLVDFDENIDINDIFGIFHDFEKGAYEDMLTYYDFKIIIEEKNIFITSCIESELYVVIKNNKYLFKRI